MKKQQSKINIKHNCLLLTLLLIVGSAIAGSGTRKPVAVIAATHSGALAIDKDSLGGNPFATALIKALARESKNIDDFMLISKLETV